ncbi:MAG: urea ABC transporter permease subunit UrtC [PS1 clade bacterium]|uniref:Urea ABC transporter permease subunit UrtC n=1 Tax=PS1 clade bacterium TaxID=2175152 RepID=A0A368DKW1_9PROT|nr:MAG: urea ABC transporter permease subunit UrtC [PS1 clade bacterium]|tara:strand:+ start:18404 stop:19528 length:1125 start_codon:yes stop_codon:yes gene_type:complete
MIGKFKTFLLLSGSDVRPFLYLLVLFGALVPILNLFTPQDSILHLSDYHIALFGKYLTYGLLALSLDLIWGYCGILSLGHGAFFALGGYCMGMHLMREIGPRGVYGDPVLPDFMVFLNWTELPIAWYGFDSIIYTSLMIIIIPGLLAFIFGWFAFRSRVTGVYFSIITQAMVFAFMLAFFQNNLGFGGNNGLTDFKDILGFSLQETNTKLVFFLLSVVALGIGYYLSKKLINSHAGQVTTAIRDQEDRVRFLGYKVENFKLFVFVISGVLAGVAGALYVPQVGIINPGEFSPIKSIEIVVWVALGGRGTLYGAVIGGILVNLSKSYFTVYFPEYWLFFLGALFVFVTIFLPRGVVGLFYDLINLKNKKGVLSNV